MGKKHLSIKKQEHRAMRKLTSPPGMKTLGVNFRAFTDNFQSIETVPIMEKYDVKNVQPDQWYPTQRLMDALNELAQNANISSNMVAIGMQVGMIVPMPPDLVNPTLEQVLMAWNGIYQALHCDGDPGRIDVEKVGEKHLKISFTELYPDDFSYGIIYGYARRFLPPGTPFTVFYDEQVTPRDRGGQEGYTLIHIEWE
jgi:hypothetical protein